MERGIREIFFDLGGVLFYFNFWTICTRLSKISEMTPRQIYHCGFNSGVVQGFDQGKLSAKEFHEKICALLDKNIQYNKFVNIWCDIFQPIPEMINLVKSLKRQNYPLYLISNTNELHFEFLRKRFSFLSIFDGVTLSYKVGCLKPDAMIFRAALSSTGASPKESVFIDDIKINVSASRRLGINGLQYIHCPGVTTALKFLGVQVLPFQDK